MGGGGICLPVEIRLALFLFKEVKLNTEHWRRNDLYFGGAHLISCAIHVQYNSLFNI